MYEFLILLILPHALNSTSDEQIFTTYRDDGNYTVWDGKWTFLQEWKRTSLTTGYGENFVIRTGHDYNNLYVFLDLLSQKKFSKHSDYAVICIDSNSNLENFDHDEKCFFVTLGSQIPLTFRSGGILAIGNHFTKIENDPNLIAIGNISDENDRYTSKPHSSYEFRIPIKAIERSDVYRFYTEVYDSNENIVYSWPENLSDKTFPSIPNPSSWGQLVSPDKSLPEFPWVIVTLIIAFFTIFLFGWKKLPGFNLLMTK